MALAITVRVDFVDAKNKTSNTRIRVPNGFSIANYVEFAQGIGQIISNISQAAITKIAICFNVDLSGLGLKTVASAVTSVAKKLWLRFNTAVTGFRAQTLIPGLRETQVVTGSGDIDQTNVDVAAVVSMFEDGLVVTGGTMTFSNDREHDITALNTGTERFLRRSSA